MSIERGVPPGAAEWKAPGSEQPEVETKIELGEEIPEGERIDLNQVTQCKETFPSGKSPVRSNVDAMSPEARRKMQEQKGTFAINNGVLIFVDRGGHPYVTVETDARLKALGKAGFENGDLFVPFSNGEEPVDYSSPEGIYGPADRLRRLFDDKDRELVKDGTKKEKDEVEKSIEQRRDLTEKRRRAEDLWRRGYEDQARVEFDQLRMFPRHQ